MTKICLILIGAGVTLLVVKLPSIISRRYSTISVPGPFDDDFWRLPESEQRKHYIGNQEARVYASWYEFFLGKSIFNKLEERR